MRRFIAICTATLVAALVALAVAPLSLAPEAVRDAVADRLVALTGHAVEIRGAAELRRIPSLRFAVNDVRVHSSVPGQTGELAHIERLTGSIALLPLFAGRIEVTGVSLVRPRLALEIDRDGRGNWESPSGQAALAMSQPETYPASEVRIGDVRVEEGSIRYRDRRSGEALEVDAVTATLSWPDLTAPFAGTGSLVWRDDPVDFNFYAKDPFSFLRRGSSTARFSLHSPFATVSFSGDAHLTDNTHVRGRLSLSTESARRFLRRIGTDLGSGPGLGMLKMSGQISLLGNTAIISALRLRLDGNEAEGSLKVDIEKDRIGLQGTLAYENLDLTHYYAAAPSDDEGPAGDPLATPIDLSDLRKADADMRISAERVALGELSLGNTAGTAMLRDGALTLGLAETSVYGGGGIGTITLAPHSAGVRARVNATWERIAVAELLQTLGVGTRLEGTTRGSAKLTGHGGTLREILDDLAGEAELVVVNGALRGVDVPTLVETLGARQLTGWPTGERARTAFHRLNATLQVVDGVATTSDLRLIGPDLDVAMMADIRLAAASVVGRGDAALAQHDAVAAGDAVPFTIEGPIFAPRVRVDRAWLLDRAASDEGGGGLVPEELLDRMLERLPGMPGVR